MLKEIFLTGWAPLAGLLSILSWYMGEMPGYWSAMFCYLAFCYVMESLRNVRT